MSNISNVNTQKMVALIEKVETKLAALQCFLEGGDGGFTIPDRFSYNWFVSLSEGAFKPISKASKSLKSGTELRSKIDTALLECEQIRRNEARISKGNQPKIAELERQKRNLTAEVKRLKRQLDTKVDENIQLRRELMDMRCQLGVKQAVWADQVTSKRNLSKANYRES
ncbi:hypothetical protein [Oceanospirillum sanctuarii]|uniref:hypothetical protein n=1 Tax=Oceanospirillum sanctuarii TaxID=1434821 RepID=UPI000A38AE43|nr:hypothetical protein [Oceanospirillum sanctuarii]